MDRGEQEHEDQRELDTLKTFPGQEKRQSNHHGLLKENLEDLRKDVAVVETKPIDVGIALDDVLWYDPGMTKPAVNEEIERDHACSPEGMFEAKATDPRFEDGPEEATRDEGSGSEIERSNPGSTDVIEARSDEEDESGADENPQGNPEQVGSFEAQNRQVLTPSKLVANVTYRSR